MTVLVLTFPNDQTPLDLLLFRAFGREVAGLVDLVLKANSGLAMLGPFPPRGTQIFVTPPAAQTSANSAPLVTLYN